MAAYDSQFSCPLGMGAIQNRNNLECQTFPMRISYFASVSLSKGQLISKCPFGGFKSIKEPTKFL